MVHIKQYQKNKNGIILSNFAPFYAIEVNINSFLPKKRPEYVKCSSKELDPFNRFEAVEYPKAEYFFRIWFDEKLSFINGNVFEAIVSCHAIHKENCYNCKSRRALQWIGGGSTNELWGDMICSKCNALYEIKSRKSLQKIDNCFSKYNTQSGSFRRYYRNENVHRHYKKYLVMVSRVETYISKGFFWPVEIAEIDSVLPCLKDSSFIKRGTSIGTIIKVKTNTRKRWFNIPHLKDLDFLYLAKDVFRQCFTKETYEAFEFRRENEWKVLNNIENGKEIIKKEDAKSSINDLRCELEALNNGCDDNDWESNFCF